MDVYLCQLYMQSVGAGALRAMCQHDATAGNASRPRAGHTHAPPAMGTVESLVHAVSTSPLP